MTVELSMGCCAMSPQEKQSKFTFVNTSVSQPRADSTRSAVFRHVQGYRRRKKQEDARRLLRSSRFLQSDSVSRVPMEDDHRTNHDTSQPLLVLPPLMSVILLNADLKHMDTAPDVSSATFGNLIGFERDCVHPALQRMEYQVTHATVQYSTAWFKDTKAYLYDNLAVYSFLSRIAATMRMVTGSEVHCSMAIEFRNKAIASLRTYLQETVSPDIPRLYRALVILILAESALGDRIALAIHTKILQDLVQTYGSTMISDPIFSLGEFLTVIYQDVQIAILNLTHTFFDIAPGGWINKHFQVLWREQSANWMEQITQADHVLHPKLTGFLRCLYLELRVTMAMVVDLRQNPALLTESHTYLKAFGKGVFLLGRLINHYDSLHIESCVDIRSVMSDQAMTEAIACLCGVYWLREFFGIENVILSGSLRIFTANNIILTRLKMLVQSTHFDNDCVTLEMQLWILFTGATIESACVRSDLESEQRRIGSDQLYWCAQRLEYILQDTHLGWQDYQIALNRFLLLEHLGDLHQFKPGCF